MEQKRSKIQKQLDFTMEWFGMHSQEFLASLLELLVHADEEPELRAAA
ncbi:hypothetical protein [Nitratifractor sp.]